MADYIHNPSEWGQKLYVTSLIELFNVKGNLRLSELENKVSVS